MIFRPVRLPLIPPGAGNAVVAADDGEDARSIGIRIRSRLDPPPRREFHRSIARCAAPISRSLMVIRRPSGSIRRPVGTARISGWKP